jgi:hypothetical protein
VSEGTELGDSYRLAFTCDGAGANTAGAPGGPAPLDAGRRKEHDEEGKKERDLRDPNGESEEGAEEPGAGADEEDEEEDKRRHL